MPFSNSSLRYFSKHFLKSNFKRQQNFNLNYKRDKHYLVYYKYVDGILEKRKPFRAQHLENITNYYNDGKIVMAGAHADADGAVIIFDCEDKNTIKEFIKNDPYVINNLVTGHEIKEWMVVVSKP